MTKGSLVSVTNWKVSAFASREPRWRYIACMIGLLGWFFTLGISSVPAGTNWQNCLNKLQSAAEAKKINRSIFLKATTGLTIDPEVLDRVDNQAEFNREIWEYLDAAVDSYRVDEGRRLLVERRSVLSRIEKQYGVDRHIVMAIWGAESEYGEALKNPKIVRSVVRSLATLACQGGRYRKFGHKQLIATLQILQRGDVTLSQMSGSWAGAMGHTQFIPTTYNAYAVDFTGDGRRDIWNTIPDALASTANYLKNSGWQTGKTWGYEVVLPIKFKSSLASAKIKKTLAEWAKLGVKRPHGKTFPRPKDKAFLFLPAGKKGVAFLMLKNFNVIKRYNNADSYALAIGHLADRIRGGGPFHQSWPRLYLPLQREEIKELQTLLVSKGFNLEAIDGKAGPNTRNAIKAFQRSADLTENGFPSKKNLQLLKNSR